MVPEGPGGGASYGQRLAFKFLQLGLSDDFHVYFRHSAAASALERFPDFVVVSDVVGVLALEVRSWSIEELVTVSPQHVLVRNEDGEVQVPHPLTKGRSYMAGVAQELRAQPVLRHSSGPGQGKLSFPLGYGVILTGIRRPELSAWGGERAERLFPSERVLCRDEIAELDEAGGDALLRRLQGMLESAFLSDPLSSAQLDTIRGCLYPEIRVRAVPVPAELARRLGLMDQGAHVLKVLDKRQEHLAHAIGRGHRILFGVAGSGKTLILLARARKLALENPEARILILTCSITLACALRSRLGDDPRFSGIEVVHFHGFQRRPSKSTIGCYDAVLIDEANDFDPSWFANVKQALKDPEEGDLLIVGDGAQAIYRRGRFTWKSVGIRAVGRTLSRNFNLDRNYRNTREILELANLLVIPSGQDADDEEAHAFPTIAPEAAERTGPEPSLIACGSRTEENDQIVEWIQKLKEGRDGKALEESEIAVLYSGIGKNPGLRGPFLELLEKIGRVCDAPPYWITRDRQSQAAYRDDMPGVRVCTIHSAKGLEFPAVACPWTDQFPRPWVDDVPGERQLLYVAMTRACDHLLLTWSGELRPESLAALLAGSRGEIITP